MNLKGSPVKENMEMQAPEGRRVWLTLPNTHINLWWYFRRRSSPVGEVVSCKYASMQEYPTLCVFGGIQQPSI
jgi:hypothetical protein